MIYLFGFDATDERLLKNTIASLSGIYLEEVLPCVTHIIPFSYTMHDRQQFFLFGNTPKIVRDRWLKDCFKFKRRQNEMNYPIFPQMCPVDLTASSMSSQSQKNFNFSSRLAIETENPCQSNESNRLTAAQSSTNNQTRAAMSRGFFNNENYKFGQPTLKRSSSLTFDITSL